MTFCTHIGTDGHFSGTEAWVWVSTLLFCIVVMVKHYKYNTAWRHISWGENEERKTFLMQYKPSNEKAEHLHFLLCGSVGSGKSSIINTISSAFQKRPVVKATAGAAISLDQSQTTDYKTYQIKDNEGTVLPFVFSDTMGLENEEDAGVNTSDIIRALKGELEEGYMRRWSSHSSMEKPPLFKKAHCLVNVIAANKIPLLRESENIIKKMHEVRKAASKLGIPQVVFMTHVDLCCPLVQEDLKNIFLSKEIKEIMQTCSAVFGVPMNCIFPVKNYFEKAEVDEVTDCLILDALRTVVHFANDYLEDL